MEGYIKAYRSLTEWEWYTKSEMVHLFLHLLLSANHMDGSWRGNKIKRGQLLTSRDKLSEKTGLPVQTVRTCLNRLKSTGEIDIVSTNRHTIITINNYDSYQGRDNTNNQQINQQTDQQLTSNQPTTNQQLTTNKNKENEKNNKNVKNKEERKTIPPLFEWVENYCKERNNSVVPRQFFDFYESKGWLIGKGKMKDWQASVRTWEQRKRNDITNARESDNIGRRIKRVNEHWGREPYKPREND